MSDNAQYDFFFFETCLFHISKVQDMRNTQQGTIGQTSELLQSVCGDPLAPGLPKHTVIGQASYWISFLQN
jgi:hypothetical protein